MTPIEGTAACGSRTHLGYRFRFARGLVLLGLWAGLSLLASDTPQAQTRLVIGAGAQRGVDGTDHSGNAAELRLSHRLRPNLWLDVGVLHQSGDEDHSLLGAPDRLTRYRWNAFHVGPRWSVNFASRWHVEAALSLAHVSASRDALWGVLTPEGDIQFTRGQPYRDDSLGWLAGIALGYDIGPRQRIALEYRRLHASIAERCEREQGLEFCGRLGSGSSNSLGLTWQLQFD